MKTDKLILVVDTMKLPMKRMAIIINSLINSNMNAKNILGYSTSKKETINLNTISPMTKHKSINKFQLKNHISK